MSDQNLTPEQQAMPSIVKRKAYERVPMTCEAVRGILDDAGRGIMADLEIPLEEFAAVDHHISQAFLRVRDEVTQMFRTEQMRLLKLLQSDIEEKLFHHVIDQGGE